MTAEVHFFQQGYPVTPVPFIGNTFSHWITLTPLSKSNWLSWYESVSDFCLFHWSTCLSLCHYHTIWLYYILKLSVIVCPVLSTTWNQVGQFPGCSLASSSFTPQMHGLVFSMVSPLLRFLELFSWVPPSSLELWSAFYCLSLPDVQSATTLLGISLPALHPECASEQKLGPLQSSLHVSFSQGSQSWAACCPMPQNSHLKTFVSFSSFFMDGG